MAKPIELELVANSKQFAKGTKDAASALEGVSDSLDDLTKDAAKSATKVDGSADKIGDSLDGISGHAKDAGDDIGTKIKGGSEDAQTAVDNLEAKFKNIAPVAQTQSKQAGDALGTDFKRGAKEASEGLDEVKESSRSNAIEVAASFDGSAQSIADGFQGLAAEVFAGFGPAGVVAGLAAAAGIGLISTALQHGDEQTEAWKSDVSDLASELISAGKKGGPSLDFLVDKLKTLATTTDKGAVNLDKLFDVSEKSGSSAKDLAQAYAGVTGELQKKLDAGRDVYESDLDQKDALYDLTGAEKEASDAAGNTIVAANDKAKAQDKYNQYLVDARDKAIAAQKEQDQYVKAGGPELEQKARLVSQVNDAYDAGLTDIDDYIDKESGLLDTGRYIKAFETKAKSLADYKDNLAKSGLSESAQKFLSEQGADVSSTLVQGFIDASPKDRAKLEKYWTEAGKDDSGSYTGTVQAGLDNNPLKPKVAAPDLSAAKKAIADFASNDIKFTLVPQLQTRNGKRAI